MLLMMQTHVSIALFLLALPTYTVQAAVSLTVSNQCSKSIELYDNVVVQIVPAGGTTNRTLAQGFSGMFRNGTSAQATLAEFSVSGGYFWYDASIIPCGRVGPGDCSSLKECKVLTGGTGFNTPLQIAPSGCKTVTCLEDGCADAYQFPKDDRKTHACADTTSVVLTFCPNGTGDAPEQSQQEQPDQSQQDQPDQSQQEQPDQSQQEQPDQSRQEQPDQSQQEQPEQSKQEQPKQSKQEQSKPGQAQQEQPKQGQFSPESKTPAPTPAPTPSVPPARVPVDAPHVSTKEPVAPSLAQHVTQSARPPVTPCDVSTLETPVAAMETPSTIVPKLEASRNASSTAARGVAGDREKAHVTDEAKTEGATSAVLPPIYYSSRSKASDVRASSTPDGQPMPETPRVEPQQDTTPATAAATTTTASSGLTTLSRARPSVATSDETERVTTQSRQDGRGASAGTYVATGLGCLAVVAAVVMVLVTHKKKQALDAKDDYNTPQDLMTPVTEINVL
ncbi:hypothetical protein PsorP6_016323 [Peronosclerospora sorghi]|uniref:Uncharacterized protein n=1 Tax=Peronosclerospora sorghi TaxID=230839 RepID=A0ACC0VLD2_9STRA|nr:hypothetical protein PsorP6_016323 [Peronosclerospora sorghi]